MREVKRDERLRDNWSTGYEEVSIYNSTGLKLHTPGPKYKSSKNKVQYLQFTSVFKLQVN
jgi:hypothetical protein